MDRRARQRVDMRRRTAAGGPTTCTCAHAYAIPSGGPLMHFDVGTRIGAADRGLRVAGTAMPLHAWQSVVAG